MSGYELHVGDCVEWLRGIEDASVDLVVTDPAYESLEKHRAIGTTTRLTADWFPIFGNERLADLLAELYRVLKQDTHCYVFCDQETMHVLHRLIEDDVVFAAPRRHPFRWWKFLVWEKTRATKHEDEDEAGPSAGMGYHYRAAHECVVFLEKGKRKLRNLGTCDVLRAPRVRGGYPTEKPVDVLATLVGQSSEPGELVIDPFLGSGSAGEAAMLLGRRFAGCDVTQRSVDLAGQRLYQKYATDPGRVLTSRRPPAQGSLFG